MADNKGGMRVVTELPKATRGSGAGIEFIQEAVAVLKENPGQWVFLGEFKGPTAQTRKQKLEIKGGFEKDSLQAVTRKGEGFEQDDDGNPTEKHMVALYARYTPPQQEEAVNVQRKAKGAKASADAGA